MGYQIMENIKVSQPLELKQAFNVRDLGVYYNKAGQKLQEKRFLRADALHSLTKEDIEVIKSYGVTCIVDLRSPMELEQAPCILKKEEDITYYSIPLFDDIQSNDGSVKMPESLYSLYQSLLEDSAPQIREVLRSFLRHGNTCCLFNCTAGKDRTGIIAMLLLGLAGVEDEVIVADYSVSAENMSPVFSKQREAMKKAGYEIAEFLLDSRAEEMEKTLAFVKERYGSIQNYLQKLLSESEINGLRSKLVLG